MTVLVFNDSNLVLASSKPEVLPFLMPLSRPAAGFAEVKGVLGAAEKKEADGVAGLTEDGVPREREPAAVPIPEEAGLAVPAALPATEGRADKGAVVRRVLAELAAGFDREEDPVMPPAGLAVFSP